MKVRFNRWYNTVLTALLAMLGYESCSDTVLDEYGCPSANYQVKGSVTDLTGTPIPGIRVRHPHNYIDLNEGQSVLTDENGHFVLDEFTSVVYDELIVEDIDGKANGGEFQSDTIKILDLPKKEIEKGDGRWYEGKFEVNANIRLEKKK